MTTFRKANKFAKQERMLQDEDLPPLGYNERIDTLEKNLRKLYKEEKTKNPNVKLSKVAFKAHKSDAILSFIFDMTYKSLRVFSVWVAKQLLDHLTDLEVPVIQCVKWAGILGAIMILASYFEQHWMFIATKTGIRVKNELVKMVYDKLTRISVHSLNDLSIGKIVNVVANDVNIFERRGFFFTTVYIGIPTLLGGVAVLWTFFGPASLVGIAFMILSIPVQLILIGASTRPQVQKNGITDERVKLTSELIEGIRLLKMYTWEMIFTESIKKLRDKEIALLKRGASFEGIARGFALSVTSMASYLTFMTYALLGHKLDVATVFPTFFFMGFLRIHVIMYTLGGFSFIAESRLIFQRVEQVMAAPEIKGRDVIEPRNPENSVEFHGFAGYWSKHPNQGPEDQVDTREGSPNIEIKPAIRDINLEIKKGSLQAIVGPVGCGKSSLLLSFTGEMPRTTGSLCFSGSTAYAEQEPTIFPGLLRDNILFGKEYDPFFYRQVVNACCLDNDFKQFNDGDMTEIGEKGVNLSGGQKARVALARAIYSQADIYLLDDPLSAVDAKVAKRLYDEAICGMLKGKTVLLVTHQVHFVKDVSNIIVMMDGRAVGKGSFAELKAQKVDVDNIFNVDRLNRSSLLLQSSNSIASLPVSESMLGSQNNIDLEASIEEAEEEELLKVGRDVEDEKAKILNAEDPKSGRVTSTTYKEYVKAMGNVCLTIFVSFVFFGSVASDLVFARFIGLWAEDSPDLPQEKAIWLIGVLVAVIFVAYLVKSVVFANVVLTAAKNLHNRMIDRLIRSPPVFFDTNPVGRILNRFSNDVGVLDKFLPLPLEDVLTTSFAFFVIMIAVGVITPPTLGPIFIGGIIVYLMTRFCQEGVKQTKIFELTSRSPMYSLFSLTLSGLISIRSYNQADAFKKKFTNLLNSNLKAHISFVSNNQFLGLSIDLAYTLISISTIMLLLFFRDKEASLIGLTLSFLLILSGMLQFNVRTLVQAKILMSSTARVLNYCKIKSELPLETPKDNELMVTNWPQQGRIDFKNVFMKYREDSEYVIKGLTFQVQPGEKIGCVGRTGAGKSSIIQLLFRMVEIDREGKDSQASYIKIDDVDIQEVGLHLLRNNISIIPQIPVVFNGTIRRNLDPLQRHSDDELWKILEEVNLREYVENIEEQLYADMSNAASVFSVGQKQLICLARAILKKSRIVVLDEATANVDSQTDHFIQQKIMERFGHCTVFTIAHRLSTIANYDKALVLDKGEIVEFDAPYKLLVKEIGDDSITNPEGHFASMVLNTGPKAAQNIFRKAKSKYFPH